jgi:hypothetical protein
MTLKRWRKKNSWLKSRQACYPGICLDGMRKRRKDLKTVTVLTDV